MVAASAALLVPGMRAACQSAEDLQRWGTACLDQIQTDFKIPGSALYADDWRTEVDKKPRPAFNWGCGVLVPALNAAVGADKPRYNGELTGYIKALDVYLTDGPNKIPAYDVLPGPKPFDRYYDDNMWMDMALLDAYQITGDRSILKRADNLIKFIMSGEDKLLGGGIYWREQEKTSKNTCSNGPAVVCLVRHYQITHKQEFLTAAKRIYSWTKSHLQDTDGLYWDNIKLDGGIEKTKWTYNTALMIRAACLLSNITGDKSYLKEAERVAAAAEAQWVSKDTGAIEDGGQFAHLLCEAFLVLGQTNGDPHWAKSVTRALGFVHDQCQDSAGHYGDRWNQPVTATQQKVSLLSQASVARAFLNTAQVLKQTQNRL